MVLAGGTSSRKLDLDAFIRQAGEYEEWSSGWDKLNRLRTELLLTHSYPVRRVKEVMAWVHSGEYDRIVGGEYPTRDQTGRRAQGGRATRSSSTRSASARSSTSSAATRRASGSPTRARRSATPLQARGPAQEQRPE